MTPQEAKELSIEVWTYLAEHPDCYRKYHIPMHLYDQIKGMRRLCPLCELYLYRRSEDDEYSCRKQCPLYRCTYKNSTYSRWERGLCDIDRRNAAQDILVKLKAWEP